MLRDKIIPCMRAMAPLLLGLAVGGCATRGPSPVGIAPAMSERVAELCAGVPETERARPYFLQGRGIAGVHELTRGQRHVKFAKSELRGVEIALRADPEETRHRADRLLRCHLVWREAVSLAADTLFDDPLTVGTPDVSLDETEGGIVLRIEGRDRAEGEEILRRAEALLGRTSIARD
jgi:hypothetical protein